uniref:Fibronectin type-III domain-containing protein n=1 Tax=Leptobrachium leishanense TaxID=445787 RepID=A0A8C5R2U3_9ANUR
MTDSSALKSKGTVWGLRAPEMAYIPMYLNPAVLVLFSCDLCLVRGNRPPSPVNVTVTQLKANSATVSWDVPEGDIIIGYAISQQVRYCSSRHKTWGTWDRRHQLSHNYIIIIIMIYIAPTVSTVLYNKQRERGTDKQTRALLIGVYNLEGLGLRIGRPGEFYWMAGSLVTVVWEWWGHRSSFNPV